MDAENAIQPLSSFDGRVLVSMNGEIYNHAELRVELEAKGVRFRTGSDTEVLASALRIWGVHALNRLNGMFAFVAIDVATGEFVAARDRWGVKPLYLIQSHDGFIFCSEMRPLLRTIEEGEVLLLPAGHLLTRKACVRYSPKIVSHLEATAEHLPKALDEMLAAAVHRRVPQDLPCAIMFSGEIDSTLIAHYTRQVRGETPGYFIGDSRAPDYAYAVHYAEQTGFDLRFVSLGEGTQDLSACIVKVVEAVESFEPSVIQNSLCTYLLSRRIHQDGFRVALCGEGADELFAGYLPLELAFADSQLAGSYVRDQCLGNMHRVNLQRLDRCSMRFQVEVREPFLDPEISSYALNLKNSALVEKNDDDIRGKAPLRSLYDLYPDQLPCLIRDRRKVPLHQGSGFGSGDDRTPWTIHAEQTISDRGLADGRKQFASFRVRDKEELYYLQILAAGMNIERVPHLKDRLYLRIPNIAGLEKLAVTSA